MALPGSMELKIAAEFRRRIEEYLGEGLRDVRLFGSRVRGTANPIWISLFSLTGMIESGEAVLSIWRTKSTWNTIL
jgi:predicted nucleotidyltransferase